MYCKPNCIRESPTHDLRIRISTEEAVVHCCSGVLGPKIGFLQRFGRPSDGVAVTWMILEMAW